MAVLLLILNLHPSPIWIPYSSWGFDIRANCFYGILWIWPKYFFLEKTNLKILKFLLMKVFAVRQTQKPWNQGGGRITNYWDWNFIMKNIYSRQIHFSDQVRPPLASSCTSKSSRVFLNWIISQTGRNWQDKIFFWVASRYIFYKNIWFGHLVLC